MSPPTHFGLEYEINPLMHVDIPIQKEKAQREWERLRTIVAKNAIISTIDPANKPDFVFTANAGLVRDKEIILSSFKFPERQPEEPYWRSWFQNQGYTTHELHGVSFEGAGDALFVDKHTLVGGYGFRSDKRAYDSIEAIWPDIHTIRVELIDNRFYHLDTCLCPLDEQTILYFPDAFSVASQNELQKTFRCIPVSQHDALRFVCNAVVCGQTIIVPHGAYDTMQKLTRHGFTIYEVDMTEFLKSGGAAKCLTLSI